MNVTEKEVTITQKVYELTEDELHKLKNKYYNAGITDTKRYIIYCFQNFGLVLNIGFAIRFLDNVIRFCIGKTASMENKNNLSFQDFVDGKR